MYGAKPGGFGQPTANTGFGPFANNAAPSSPFGQTTAFGKPATIGAFGATSAFGQQPTTSLFGQTQPSTGLFGASTNTAPTFGGTATTQSGFGGAFGQPQQQTTSLFGTQNNTTANTSLFGNNNNTAFGAAKPAAFGFGQTSTQSSLFGQSSTTNTTTGFFGQNAQSGGLFGAKPAFGATSPVAGGNGTAVAKYQQTLGTDTLVKNGQTNTVNTKQHCITFMKEYENKSVEELRYEDYAANRKGPQAGATGTGLFGATAPTTGLFGATTGQASLFGQQTAAQPSTSLFGTTTNTFGQTTTPSFGAAQNNTFGKPFGTTPATAAPAFGFGQATTTTLGGLGANKPAFGPTSTGLFGQTATPATNTFGQPSTFGFGAQAATQPGGLFSGTGGTATAPVSSAFGGLATQTTQTGFGFGTNTQTSTAGGGLFGAKPANTFGTLGSSFAQNATSSAPSFGFGTNTNTGGSMFGNTFNKPAAPTFGLNTGNATGTLGSGLTFGGGSNSLFGNTANKPGGLGTGTGLFGNTSTLGGGSTFGTLGMNTFGGGLGNNSCMVGTIQPGQQAVPIHQQILAMATSPYGDNPIFKDLKPLTGATEDSLRPTNPSAQKAILEGSNQQFKVSPKVGLGSGIKVKPVGASLSKKSLFEGLEEYDSTLEESFSLKPSAKRLIIKAKSPKPTVSIQDSVTPVVTPSAANETLPGTPGTPKTTETFRNQIPLNPVENTNAADTSRRVSWLQSNVLERVRQQGNQRHSDSILENTIKDFAPISNPLGTAASGKENVNTSLDSSVSPSGGTVSPSNVPAKGKEMPTSSSPMSSNMTVNDSFVSNRSSFLNETSAIGVGADLTTASIPEEGEPHPTGIVLRRPGYYTIPSLEEILLLMDDEGRCIVPNFTIGRKGYGNVYFNESIDVAGLNLDEIVHFRHKEVIIYPDDDNKPPIGSGLNRKAQVTLDQVWPHDKALHEPIKDAQRLAIMDYEGKLRRVCDKHDTRFLEYRPDTGSWVFKVEHFSKYGLSDSDEEAEPTDPKKPKMTAPLQTLPGKDKHGNSVAPKPIAAGGLFSDDTANNNSSGAVMSASETPTSPTAAIAMDMGTDSHKLQLMKASFFVDDDFDRRSVLSEITTEGRDSPDQIVPTQTKSSYFSLNRGLSQSMYGKPGTPRSIDRMDTLGSLHLDEPSTIVGGALFKTSTTRHIQPDVPLRKDTPVAPIPRPIGPQSRPLVLKPKVESLNPINTVIPLHKSILGRFLNSKSNLAFFHGRKFKIGWSFPTTMVQLNSSDNCAVLQRGMPLFIGALKACFNGRKENDYSPATLQLMHIASTAPTDEFEATVDGHLRIQLKHDVVKKSSDSDCPYLVAGGKQVALQEHLEEARHLENIGEYEEFGVEVWSLCAALWGSREELEGVEDGSHLNTMFRRDLLSEWIEGVVTDQSTREIKLAEKREYLDQLVELINTHKVLDACELAFQNNDINLSMLLAQISGGPTVRQLMQHQLSSWQDVESDKFIDPRRLKLFMLVGGIPLMSSTHGTINVFEHLDWLKALALQLWYLSSPTASITDALLAYEKNFEAEEFYAMPPVPPYNARFKMDPSKPIYDLRFHLLKLYSKRSHAMETLLNPASHTGDPMDYRLSWCLLQVLETLGYHHCSELSRSHIHTSFASQLENHGLWHWSIYVLLHLNDQSRRELAIQDLLYRHIDLTDDDEYLERENFIINELGVPEKWIFWAKAVKAGSVYDHRQQAQFLLKAKQWSLAHEVIMEHLAPDCFMNDKISYLKSLLDTFEDTKQIANWAIKGQILADYIHLNEQFDVLAKTIDDEMAEQRLEDLKPKLSDLCLVLKMFPCPTPKHVLLQSEIAQRLAFLIRSFFVDDPHISGSALLRSALEKLPLPEEYVTQELQHMLRAYIAEAVQ